MSGSLIQQYTQQPQQQSGGSLLIPQYTQPQSGGLLNIKPDAGYWGGTGVNTPKPAMQQAAAAAAAAPAAAQQQPPQWGTPNGMSPNAQAQDWIDRYAKTLTGAPFASLGNGPIDPGALMLLGQMNPDLAAQYYTGPYSPFGPGGAWSGGSGGYGEQGGGGQANTSGGNARDSDR